MLLKKIIKIKDPKLKDLKVKGLAINSKEVRKDYIFFAKDGIRTNGKKYINEALRLGANIVVYSGNLNSKINGLKYLKVKNINKTVVEACKNFYTSKPKNIFAVTGTNGKSSVVDLFCQILKHNKISVGSIGTLGIKINNKLKKKVKLTNPDILSLHKELSNMKKKGINNVILEASSHGLKQGRVAGLDLNLGMFTNFSQDHLDYHKTKKDYLNSKLLLFSKYLKKRSNVIITSEFKYKKKIERICKKKQLKINIIKKKFTKSLQSRTNLIGEIQLKNLAFSIIAANKVGLSLKKIFKSLKNLKNIEGRLELVRTFSDKTKIFVDYAHTPDALEQSILSLKNYYNKNIALVFGCGGDRDKGKRSFMAKIANKYCDHIFITDDNPRNENPKKIRATILKNIDKKKATEVPSRSKAIHHALNKFRDEKIILVSGKGHENEQIYKDKIIKISDKKIIKSFKDTFNNISNKYANNFNAQVLKNILNTKSKHPFNKISIDSNLVKQNNLFLAIRGKNNDGHNYISQAKKRGAKYFIVSKIKNRGFKNHFKVKNTLSFLRKFAYEKRRLISTKIIGITGSSGKTTFKDCLAQILSFYARTYFSPKSYNNHIGVPLSVSNIQPDHKYGIFEIGMSNTGEIFNLSKIVKPEISVITSIGEAHIENFKNLEGIAKAKSEIIDNTKIGGALIINKDIPYYNFFVKKAKKRNLKIVNYSMTKKADIYFIKKTIKNNLNNIKISYFKKPMNLIVKDINFNNVLAIMAVLKILNLNLIKIKHLIKTLSPIKGRGKNFRVKIFNKLINLIDESYNANPLSVTNVINNYNDLRAGNRKKYLLIGDMLELGKKTHHYHLKIANIINQSSIDKVFIIGENFNKVFKFIKSSKRGNILQSIEDFDFVFENILKRNDYLLIKGSNKTGLNNFVNKIIKRSKLAI